jgi:hypothetical protein
MILISITVSLINVSLLRIKHQLNYKNRLYRSKLVTNKYKHLLGANNRKNRLDFQYVNGAGSILLKG